MVNFGIKTDKDNTVYVNLNGGEKDKVYFMKSEMVDGKRNSTIEEVSWKDRHNFKKEGFKLIGINVGVTKKLDEKNNSVNDKKMLTDYDACKEIGDNLKDEQCLFVKGTIDYSHFDSNGNTKRSVKYMPTQVSLCKNVDFDAEDFTPTSFFTQTIVYTGIEQDQNDKSRFMVSGKVIGYNSIEDAEFIILDKGLATQFKKNLKPYSSIAVSGKIVMTKDTEEVTTEDVWGEKNPMNRINTPTIRELIITGADPKTIDTETYTEAAIDEAMAKLNANKKAEKDFGKSDDGKWGSVGNSSTGSDEEDPW
jgi:hypothetical protein